MENKNINNGNIDTNGGTVHIGDSVTNIVENLSFLLQEFAAQLKDIESLIKSFKPSTALILLKGLEERVDALDLQKKNKVQGKLFYLKALCKRDLSLSLSPDIFMEFLRAYHLDQDDKILKRDALFAYTNLKDYAKASALADSILKYDEYDANAWFAKLVLSDNAQEFIKDIPIPVFSNPAFQINVLHYFMERGVIYLIEEIEDYGLNWKDCLHLDKEVTYGNRERWLKAIDVRFIDQIRKNDQKQILHGNLFLEETPEISALLEIASEYINVLKDTEISSTLSHQKYILYSFQELTSKEGKHTDKLVEVYHSLFQPKWLYTGIICQILIRDKQPQKSLDILYAYESSGGNTNAGFYLLKFLSCHLNKETKGQRETFDAYILNVGTIDEESAYNIINSFILALAPNLTREELLDYFTLFEFKPFLYAELKELFQITFQVRYLKTYDPSEIHEKLLALTKIEDLEIPWRGILAENLISIGKRKDSINYLDSFVDKDNVSEILHFYIRSLYDQLTDKNDDEQGRYKELLQLLKLWRSKSSQPDELFLGFEHNLYTEIADLDNLEEVDKFLHEKFPGNERYLLAYLSVLENKGKNAEVAQLAKAIQVDFKDEKAGIAISGILFRHNEKSKGFDIIYNLASNPSNTLARSSYFSSSNMFSEFFERYGEVRLNTWVIFRVDGEKQKQHVTKENGLQGELLNKEVGETFVTTISLTNKIVNVEIVEVFNDATNLFREILGEAQNPLNDLGIQIQSMKLPTNTADLEQALIQQFGAIGTQEKENKEQLLKEYYTYQIGFTEIVNFVFKNNIDAYLDLTNDSRGKFTTLPNITTLGLDTTATIDFILDFSTLTLFYNLDKEMGFNPIHRFLISPLIKREIENSLVEAKHSSDSFMSVQITLDYVSKSLTDENYKERKIEFLQTMLKWIDAHCVVTPVEEKLDTVPKLKQNEKIINNQSAEMLTDYIYLSSREKCRLVSSDVTLLRFKVDSNLYHNIINPEKYLLTYFPDKIDTTFYRYLLSSNYIGINITFDTLRNEFYDFLSGKENYYLRCLENLEFNLHGNIAIVNAISRFLREMYLMPALRAEDKYRYALQIVKSVSRGMNVNQFQQFLYSVKQKFKLMGNMYQEILSIFNIVLKGELSPFI